MSSVVIAGDTSGSITLAAPAVAGSNTITLPANTGTVITTASNGQVIPKAALPTGSVLQVVQAPVKTDGFTTTSTSYVDITGMSVSITPISSSSKILILANGMLAGVANVGAAFVRLVKNSTALGTFGDTSVGTYYAAYWNPNSPDTDRAYANIVINYLDSPSTTSSITYKLQLYSYNGGTVAWGTRFASGSNLPAQGGTSSITVMEIAG